MLLSEVAQIMKGEWLGQDALFTRVCIDTRKLQSGDLYIALKGHQFDGHDFVESACAKDACGVVIHADCWAKLEEKLQPLLAQKKIVVIKVAETKLALGSLAKAWQRAHPVRRAAVTGSCGKTSVKEMVALILGQSGSVLATQGNLNNDIGAPLTLLRLSEKYQYGVFELGANHKGEIDYTSALVEPHVALITNADAAHLEGFGSVEKVAQAKAEIYRHLTPDGVAVINYDDPHSIYWHEQCAGKRIVTFSLQSNAHATYQLISGRSSGPAGSVIIVNTPAGEVELTIPLMGRHQWANALAALAVTHVLGISLDQVKTALAQLQPVSGRLNPKTIIVENHSLVVIDDTYNANPFSVRAAINILAECQHPQILVLGDMGELGENSAELHREIGSYAQEKEIDYLFSVGRYAVHTREGFGVAGVAVETQDQLLTQLKPLLNEAMTILVKGSRSAKMEQVVEALLREGE